MSYAQFLPNLQHLQLVQLRTLAPPVGRLLVGYDANARCNFHSGEPGHTIENCNAFKHVVQDLIDSKAINFAPAPNGIQALLDDGILQAEDLSAQRSIEGVVEGVVENADVDPLFPEDAEEFKNVVPANFVIPNDVINFSDAIADIPNIMVDSNVFIELDSDVSDVCTSINEISEYDCDVATITIFYPTAQISAPVAQPVPPVRPHQSTMTIMTPGPLSFTSERAIPWHYGGSMYTHDHGVEQPLKVEEVQDQKSEPKIEIKDPAVDNVGGIWRFTRSGRLFSPPVTQPDSVDAAEKAKGKQVVNEGTSAPQAGSEPAFAKDVDELLRIIKKSDYKEISVNQLEGIVANVHTSNRLGFTDSDLTPAGHDHNKASTSRWSVKTLCYPMFWWIQIKFPVNGRIITVCGEEDILVSNLSTFKYVEVEGEIHETLCQAFEAVQVKDAAPMEEVEAGASFSSFKQAHALVNSGVAPGWGRLVDLPVKEDKFGIGYQPTLTSKTLTPQTRQGPITFSSAGIIQYG
ncbi:hypothetical protein KIW84_062309 [Lathyrus oleraceus]|uniref:Gag-pol polyprotein n=1 Tax=Pisum sativum TaxID=3888 RepID=A0A9D5A862_PEA|nr:hypothetical protein KIW84_062309 [Pisum sativum]